MKRVIFNIDEPSYLSLLEIQRKSDCVDLAQTVQKALELQACLQKQAEDSYTQVILRNPNTNEEITMVRNGKNSKTL